MEVSFLLCQAVLFGNKQHLQQLLPLEISNVKINDLLNKVLFKKHVLETFLFNMEFNEFLRIYR